MAATITPSMITQAQAVSKDHFILLMQNASKGKRGQFWKSVVLVPEWRNHTRVLSFMRSLRVNKIANDLLARLICLRLSPTFSQGVPDLTASAPIKPNLEFALPAHIETLSLRTSGKFPQVRPIPHRQSRRASPAWRLCSFATGARQAPWLTN